MNLKTWLIASCARAISLGRYIDDGPTSLAVSQHPEHDLAPQSAIEFVQEALEAHQSARTKVVVIHFAWSPGQNLTLAQVQRGLEIHDEVHGLRGIPRHVIEHAKDRTPGLESDAGAPLAEHHFHLLYYGVDPETGRVVPTYRNYVANEQVSRIQEVEFGHPLTLGRHALANWKRLRLQERDGARTSYDAGAVATAIAHAATLQLQVAGYDPPEDEAALMQLWNKELRPGAEHTEGERRAERRSGIPARLVDGLVAEAAQVSAEGLAVQRGPRFRDALAARDLTLCLGDKGNLMVADPEGEARDVGRCMKAARKARGLPAQSRHEAALELQALEAGLDRDDLPRASAIRAAGRTDEQQSYADRLAGLRTEIRDLGRSIELAEATGDYEKAKEWAQEQRKIGKALAEHVWNGRPRLTAAVAQPAITLDPVERDGRLLYQSEPDGIVVWSHAEQSDLRLALRHAVARYPGQAIIADPRAAGRAFLARLTPVAEEEGIALANPYVPRLPGQAALPAPASVESPRTAPAALPEVAIPSIQPPVAASIHYAPARPLALQKSTGVLARELARQAVAGRAEAANKAESTAAAFRLRPGADFDEAMEAMRRIRREGLRKLRKRGRHTLAALAREQSPHERRALEGGLEMLRDEMAVRMAGSRREHLEARQRIERALRVVVGEARELAQASLALARAAPDFVGRLERAAAETATPLMVQSVLAGSAFQAERRTNRAAGQAATSLDEHLARLESGARQLAAVALETGGIRLADQRQLSGALNVAMGALAWVPPTGTTGVSPVERAREALTPARYPLAPLLSETPEEIRRGTTAKTRSAADRHRFESNRRDEAEATHSPTNVGSRKPRGGSAR